MMRTVTAVLISAVAAGVAAAGCQRPPAVVDPDDDAGSAESSAIRTSAGEYVLRPQGGGWAVDIPISFRNTSGATLYIVNCRGMLAPVLEKLTADRWEPFWSGVQLQCLSPPIVIAPDASIQDTVQVWGALPGGNTEPSFPSADLDGTYRIVLGSVVHNYDASYSAGRFGDPVAVEHRSSNRFRLRRQ
jgi:hypothetical protein